MAKYYKFKYAITLSSSLFLNLLLLLHLFFDRQFSLSWSRRAAEVVAAVPCLGHGRAFLDGLLMEDGKHMCECYSCYSGRDCSDFLPDCPADANSGNPLFLEPFWMQHKETSAVMVAGSHRIGYNMEVASSSISYQLEKLIRQLHSIVGNANTTGRFLVIGVGSTQLLNAAIRALSSSYNQHSSPARVVATAPFYPAYQIQSEFWNGKEFKWEGDTSLWKNKSNPSMNFIEFVTSPNNPDGQLKTSVLGGPTAKSIHDHAYYWPHFSAIPSPADEDLMLFSISKITGHAGSRLGWALIKDEDVYERLARYVELNTMGVSHDTQLRAMRLLQTVIKGNGKDFFGFGYKTMRERWQKLSDTLSRTKRFSLQQLSPQFCTYFGNVTGPSPAYAWFKCERDEDEDCEAVLRRAGIISRGGSLFGVEKRYVRLSLIKSQDDFDWLFHRLEELIANEESAASL